MTLSPMTLILLVAVGIAAVRLDLKTRIIPDWLTLGALGAFLLLAVLHGHFAFALLGAVLPGTLLLLIAIAVGGLGGGDLKYLAAVGAALGPLGGFLALFVAAIIGVLQGLWQQRHGRGSYPFGPAIAAGSLLAPLLWPLLVPSLVGR